MSTAEQIWGRIQEATGMNTLKELAEVAGANYQYLAKKIKKGEFSTDWAFKVAQQYKLSTDWILTGEGPIKEGEATEDKYLIMLDQWLREYTGQDKRKRAFFELKLEDTFPEYKDWLEEKGGGEQTD